MVRSSGIGHVRQPASEFGRRAKQGIEGTMCAKYSEIILNILASSERREIRATELRPVGAEAIERDKATRVAIVACSSHCARSTVSALKHYLLAAKPLTRQTRG
jgi:hypothetical protein